MAAASVVARATLPGLGLVPALGRGQRLQGAGGPACLRRAPEQGQGQRGMSVATGAAAQLLAPCLEAFRVAEPPLPDDELGAAVLATFEELFWGALAVPRVLDSFCRLQAGEEFVKHHPGLGLEHANSYIEGLSTTPFPDPHSGAYRWLQAVEAQAAAIQREFLEVTQDPDLPRKGNNIWVPAVRGDATGYGDDWRTLVLQDRGRWDDDNAKLFPETVHFFKQLNAPTLEVFFARQPAGTGIKSHTDFVNFIQTTHLGLQVPEGDCWIKVGEQTRHWEEGKALVCHTSFMHETANNTDRERVVLIMRHFHPEVTPLERTALQFIFDALDNPTRSGVAAAAAAAKEELAASAIGAALLARGAKGKRGKKASAGGSKGFGGGSAGGKGFGKA